MGSGIGVHVQSRLPGKAGDGMGVALRTMLLETQPTPAALSKVTGIILGFDNLEETRKPTLHRLVQRVSV